LKECIAKLLKQTVPLKEIIIINNNSIDGTKEYLNELQKIENKISVIHEPKNIGSSGGFAKGIETVKQKDNIDFVLILDDDAIIAENYVELLLQNSGLSTAICGIVLNVDKSIQVEHRGSFNHSSFNLNLHQPIKYDFEHSREIEFCSFVGMLLSHNLIRSINPPEKKLFLHGDDLEYCSRINQKTKFLCIKKATIIHKTKKFKYFGPKPFSPLEYYSLRNKLVIGKKMKKSFPIFKMIVGGLILKKIIVKLIFQNKNKILSIKTYLKAFNDGLKLNLK
jgi:GT2 family glycosyltransferase